MGKPSRSREQADRNGADITLVMPPLPVLERPLAVALLTLLQHAAGDEQPNGSNPRPGEAVRS
jgi:hypothetical protein